MEPPAFHSTRHTLAVTGVLIWVTLILGLYYWVHKPLTPALAGAVGGALLDGAVAAAFTLVAGGAGRRLLRRSDLAFLSASERLAVTGLFGLAALSLLIMGAGSIRLDRLSVAILLAGVATLTWRDLKAWAAEWWSWLRGGLPRDRWERFLALTALALLLLALALALLPPTKWDVLTYHLAGPEQYVERGRFYAVQHNHFLGFPQLVDTLYAGQLALTGRLTGSAPLHWVIGVFALMMAGSYTARHSSAAAGWLTVNALLASASIWLEMTFAYVDLMPLALALVALALVGRWDAIRQARSAGRGYLVWAGTAVGLAMGAKYSALWLGVAVGVLVLWLGRREGWRASLRDGLLYGVAAMVTLAPWLLRNTIWYGNPVYPLVFEAGEMDSVRQDWYSQPRSGLAYGPNAWQIPILPLTATVLGVEGAEWYSFDAGPLFLILAPLIMLTWGVLAREERRAVGHALAIAGIVTVAWMVSSALGSYISLQTRLVAYLFGPLAVVAGIALESLRHLPQKPIHLGFVLRALVVLVLAFTLIAGLRTLNASGIQHYFSGEKGYASAYLEHALGWHYATMRQINRLPAGATVRFLWEPRYLYCDAMRLTCHTDSLMDAWYYARRTVGDGSPAAIAERWRADGADYLLVYEFGRNFERESAALYAPSDWAAWDAFVRDYLIEEWRNGNADDDVQYILYRWRG